MIAAQKISVHQHYASGSRRDYIRIEFDRMSFPSTENKVLGAQVDQLQSVKGTLDFLCLTENEEMEWTHDGCFLCVNGEISVNGVDKTGFAYYRLLLDKNKWDKLRNDAMCNSANELLIYFSHYYGKAAVDEFGALNLIVKLGFEKISWYRKA